MPAPFNDYKWASIIASKVGGPKNLAAIIFAAGAITIEETRPVWKPALDSAVNKLKNATIKVIDSNGEVQEMTSDEIVSDSLPELEDKKPKDDDQDDGETD